MEHNRRQQALMWALEVAAHGEPEFVTLRRAEAFLLFVSIQRDHEPVSDIWADADPADLTDIGMARRNLALAQRRNRQKGC